MPSILDGLGSQTRFRWITFLAALGILATGLAVRFHSDPPVPPRPRRPPPQDVTAAFRALDGNANIYRAQIEKDAADGGVPAPTPEELGAVLPYDVVEPHAVLTLSSPPFETRDLSLSLRTGRVTAHTRQGTITREHLILHIANRGRRYIAYRIDAALPVDIRQCVDKTEILHNAIALAPGETVDRSECAREGVKSLTLERVETLALSPLGYLYVSRLFPPHTGLDPSATRGHLPPKGEICSDIPEQAIRRAQEKGTSSWRDVIDFYARHNCDRYIFQLEYHAFTRPNERALPVVATPLGGRP
jgi:hypothetical protein